jgi:hypothetical protein
VDNIFNRTDIIAQNGRTQTSAIPGASGGDPLFWTLYGRIFNISMSSPSEDKGRWASRFPSRTAT